jgi:adenylate kinase family enzyme
MRKIIVIGCPGSGKSTLSRKLHNITEIPLYHLDMMFWNEDKTTVEKSVFVKRLSEVLTKDSWIIDGNFSSTMECRMNECDTVIFLDYPTDVCLDGVEKRRGKPRGDIPWIETEEDEEFTEFIKTFNVSRKPAILALLDKYKEKNILIFKSREEADRFLNECEGKSEDR